MTSVLTIINLVLTLLNSIVQWGARTKVFKEDEALIASSILLKVTKEIQDVKETKDALNRKFDDAPSSIMQPDEFTRPPENK